MCSVYHGKWGVQKFTQERVEQKRCDDKLYYIFEEYLMTDHDYSYNLVKTYNHWIVSVCGNQSFLGRCVVWAIRDDVVDLADASIDEQLELFEILPKLRSEHRNDLMTVVLAYQGLAKGIIASVSGDPLLAAESEAALKEVLKLSEGEPASHRSHALKVIATKSLRALDRH